jgi:hypothetical protein
MIAEVYDAPTSIGMDDGTARRAPEVLARWRPPDPIGLPPGCSAHRKQHDLKRG